jgi:signal transduction histidine kinase
MSARRITHLIGAAFALFVIWQVAEHVWLLRTYPRTAEPVSFAVEVLLALAVVVAALGLARHHEATADRRDALSEAAVRVLEQEVRPALVPLLAGLEALTQRPREEVREPTHTLVRQAAAHGAALLTVIDDLARLTGAPAGPAAPCALSPSELLRQVASPHQVVAEQKHVRLQVEAEEDLPWPHGDPGAVLRLFSSLMGAAVATTPSGGAVSARAVREGRGLRLSASTSGCPSPEQGDASGRGVMTSCHHLAEALGGAASYEPGAEGGVLSVVLPAREGADA